MNNGQEKYFNYIMDRVKSDKRQDAKILLTEAFRKQSAGTLDSHYMTYYLDKMITLLNSEYIEEVKEVIMNFNLSI